MDAIFKQTRLQLITAARTGPVEHHESSERLDDRWNRIFGLACRPFAHRSRIDVLCLVRSKSAAAALVDSLPPDAASRVKFVFGSLNDPEACQRAGRQRPCWLPHRVVSERIGRRALQRKCGGHANAAPSGQSIWMPPLCPGELDVGVRNLSSAEENFLDEGCPLDPAPQHRDPYAFSKIVQEQICWKARTDWNLPLVVVRPGMIYGPGRDFLSARVGLKVGPLMVRLGGSQRLPYTFVDNCAEAVMLAGTQEGIEGESFNIVDDDLPTGRELIRERRRHGARFRQSWCPCGPSADGPLLHGLCEVFRRPASVNTHAVSRGGPVEFASILQRESQRPAELDMPDFSFGRAAADVGIPAALDAR